jgi:hypothetical protein
MHTVVIVATIYIVGFVFTWALDAYVGIGNDSENTENRIPMGLVCAIWPLIWLIVPICMLIVYLEKVKEKRINKGKQKERLRIVAEREIEKQRIEEEKILQQVENELENETKSTHTA